MKRNNLISLEITTSFSSLDVKGAQTGLRLAGGHGPARTAKEQPGLEEQRPNPLGSSIPAAVQRRHQQMARRDQEASSQLPVFKSGMVLAVACGCYLALSVFM